MDYDSERKNEKNASLGLNMLAYIEERNGSNKRRYLYFQEHTEKMKSNEQSITSHKDWYTIEDMSADRIGRAALQS